MHQTDEFVRVKRTEQAVEIYPRMLKVLCLDRYSHSDYD